MPLTDYQKASFRHHTHSSDQVIDPDTGEPAAADVAAADITDATATGIAVLTAASQSAGRTALGLGTASTHPAGDFAIAAVGTLVAATPIAAFVSLPQNTWTDVMSISLTAGTWIIIAKLYGFPIGAPADLEARLHDGTTTLVSGSYSVPTNGYDGDIPLFYAGVISGTKTIKMQGSTTSASGGHAEPDLEGNATGTNANQLFAVRVA